MGDRQISGTPWLASTAYLVSSRPVRDCLKKRQMMPEGKQMRLYSGLCVCVHAHMCGHTHTQHWKAVIKTRSYSHCKLYGQSHSQHYYAMWGPSPFSKWQVLCTPSLKRRSYKSSTNIIALLCLTPSHYLQHRDFRPWSRVLWTLVILGVALAHGDGL